MYVRVQTMDASRKTTIIVSKLTKIWDLKKEIEDEFCIPIRQQALFFQGKHLENDATLFDYSIDINNVIQVVIREDKSPSPKKSPKTKINSIKKDRDEKVDNEKKNEEEEEEEDAESTFYDIGDAIDCTDVSLGSWFEAKIIKILKKNGKLLYKVQWDLPDCKADEPFCVEEFRIRPRAWKVIKFCDLKPDQTVMLNYNLERPDEIGNWYDFTISKISPSKTIKQLIGDLHIKGNVQSTVNCKITVKNSIYDIESPVELSQRNHKLIKSRIPTTKRKIPVTCSHCKDNPRALCKECSCVVCGKKHNPAQTLLCDECDNAYHMACLDPPLTEIPDADEWYCPHCKNNENEIVKVGEKNKPRKKSNNKLVGGNRDWGQGFACVGRTKTCNIVPTNHRGPIPGIDVGTCWKFRVQVSEAGVHRPPVAGIHGKAEDCAYSIVLSGGYEDDLDNGTQFYYTGSGGRDLSGNKRTAKQSCDQTLTLMNRALALNCNAPLNSKKGNEAPEWRKGIPIRVVRNFKLAKHSIYAPSDGNRYDGLYKVVKYWPETGRSGFKVWRYLLRRDDPAPAPWTAMGKKRSKELGLDMIYPEGYLEVQEKFKQKYSGGRKRKSELIDRDQMDDFLTKKSKVAFTLTDDILNLIEADEINAKAWSSCKESLDDGKQIFLQKVRDQFCCIICQDLVIDPHTTPCAHNICRSCLKRSFSLNTYECPMCRTSLKKDYQVNINKQLSSILLKLFPGYKSK